MVALEVKLECAKRLAEMTQKAVKNALSDLSITSTAEVSEGMKNAPIVISNPY